MLNELTQTLGKMPRGDYEILFLAILPQSNSERRGGSPMRWNGIDKLTWKTKQFFFLSLTGDMY